MSVTLINAFTVPEDQASAFLEDFQKMAAIFAQAPGFIETHLHRNTGIGDPTFRFINIAVWESAEAWKAALKSAMPGRNGLPGIEAHPALYELAFHAQTHSEK